MTEWRLPAAIDAIVAALQGLGVQVWDGPIISGDYDDAIYIGFDGDYGGEELAATTVQTWAGIGQRKRDEDHTITCAVVVLLGNDSTSWKPARDKIAALLDMVGQALRNDATLGPAVGQPGPSVAQLSTGELYQEATEKGFQSRLVFTINYKSRV